jgi:tryptophan synthase alpha chain
MSRFDATFSRLKQQGKKALIPFITAGDPAPKHTVSLMHDLVKAGADVIELGVPFSDPMADGPTIQRASERALAHGVSLTMVLEMVTEFRIRDADTPVVLMGYANPIEAMGAASFADRAARAGVDGVLVVDYPPEESADFAEQLHRHGLAPIYLLAPTSSAERVAQVAKLARGFVYYVSLKGVTGAAHLDLADAEKNVGHLKASLPLPVGVGFGIRDAESAAAVARFADAVVIGSRIVQEIEASKAKDLQNNLTTLVAGFRRAIDQAC